MTIKLKCKCSNFAWSLYQAASNIDSDYVWNPLVIFLQLHGGKKEGPGNCCIIEKETRNFFCVLYLLAADKLNPC